MHVPFIFRLFLLQKLRRKYIHIFLFLAQQPLVGQSLLVHEVSRSHTTTHHSRQDSSGQVISSSQRLLPDNIRHSQQTDIHASGWIRTHNLSRRATADLRFRRSGHWDRHIYIYITIFSRYILFTSTCFDTSVSSSGNFKNLYFAKLHEFLKLKVLKLQFHNIFIIFKYISIILI